MHSFYLYIQSRSVDKQHAVISVNLENAEYKLHDLGTLNGVSMSIPWNATDPIKLEVLESCVLSDSLPCAILLLKPQIGINLQDAQGTQTASVCSSSSPKHFHNNTMFSPPTPPPPNVARVQRKSVYGLSFRQVVASAAYIQRSPPKILMSSIDYSSSVI